MENPARIRPLIAYRLTGEKRLDKRPRLWLYVSYAKRIMSP